MRLFLSILLFIGIGVLFPLFSNSISSAASVSEEKSEEKMEFKPKSILLMHIGPERKTIWPLIWYVDKLGKELAKTHVPEYLLPYCVEERVENKLVESLLKEIKNIQSHKPIDEEFGVSKIIFIQTETTQQSYILKMVQFESVLHKLTSIIPPKSYIWRYLIRIGGKRKSDS